MTAIHVHKKNCEACRLFKKYMKISKYGNKKIAVDNIIFDSKKEAGRYRELKLLLKAKEIRDLEVHKPFILQIGYMYKGKRIREITYEADFTYYDIKKRLYYVEDVKGFKTEVYKLKKKMLLYAYNDIEFIES